MKISVLLPTRGRPELMRRTVEGLRRGCSPQTELEILLKLDTDDEASVDAALGFPDSIIMSITPRGSGYADLHKYYDQLAKKASGDWFLFWNDDAEMLTQDWDLLLKEKLRNMIDPVCMLVPGIAGHHGGPQLFFLHRAIYDILGDCGPLPHYDDWFTSVMTVVSRMFYLNVWITHTELDDQTRLEKRNDSVVLPVAVARQRLAAAEKLLLHFEQQPASMDRLMMKLATAIWGDE